MPDQVQLETVDPMRNLFKHSLAFVVLCCSLAFAAGAFAQVAQPPSEQEQQLVAPIALYPDSLVAQILAAATNPTDIVQAWRWMQQHPGLQGQQLADAVDSQPWDPSVKALVQFPSVLDNMNTNLSWTSALGDAYANAPQDVLDAVQALRQQAQATGQLQSTSQQTVSSQGQTIVIEPANPEVVYVPAYDPWLVYDMPIAAYPGWIGVPGVFYDGPGLYFGAGIGIGLFGGFAWGLHDWGLDWHGRRTTYHHEPYVSRSPTFTHHHPFAGGPPTRVPDFHPNAGAQFHPAPHTGAFSGFDHGGVVRGYADRGRSSFGAGVHMTGPPGGGGFHAGGGFHGEGGGGSHGGGGHR
jgi:hypothetical protein